MSNNVVLYEIWKFFFFFLMCISNGIMYIYIYIYNKIIFYMIYNIIIIIFNN